MLALQCSTTGTFDSLPLRKSTPDRFIELPLSEDIAANGKGNAGSSEKIVLTP